MDGIREGLTTFYFEPKGVMREIFYKNGQPHGLVKDYHRTSELARETPYYEGKIHGLVKSYYRGGIIQSLLSYRKGKLDGTCRVFYSNGVLQRVALFKEGHQVGPAGIYHPSGIFKKKGKFFDLKDFRLELIYDRGVKAGSVDRKKITRSYVLLAGLLVFVFYSASPYSPFFQGFRKGVFHEIGGVPYLQKPISPPKDPPDGVFKTYYRTGELNAEISFQNGRRHGLMRRYYKNGRLQAEMRYDKGLLHGESVFFQENGRILSQTFYDRGAILRHDGEQLKGFFVEVPQDPEDESTPFLMVPQSVSDEWGKKKTVRVDLPD